MSLVYYAKYWKPFCWYVYEHCFLGLGTQIFQYSELGQHAWRNTFVNENWVQILLWRECLTARHFRSTSSISGPVQVWYVCLSICLSVYGTESLFACIYVYLSVSPSGSLCVVQPGLAHCLPSAIWLAWEQLGWNWFEVASKHMKDWCFASAAAPWMATPPTSQMPPSSLFSSKPPKSNQSPWKNSEKEILVWCASCSCCSEMEEERLHAVNVCTDG